MDQADQALEHTYTFHSKVAQTPETENITLEAVLSIMQALLPARLPKHIKESTLEVEAKSFLGKIDPATMPANPAEDLKAIRILLCINTDVPHKKKQECCDRALQSQATTGGKRITSSVLSSLSLSRSARAR